MQTRNSLAQAFCSLHTLHHQLEGRASTSKARVDRSSWKRFGSEQQKKERGQQNDTARTIKGIGQGSMNKTQLIFKFFAQM